MLVSPFFLNAQTAPQRLYVQVKPKRVDLKEDASVKPYVLTVDNDSVFYHQVIRSRESIKAYSVDKGFSSSDATFYDIEDVLSFGSVMRYSSWEPRVYQVIVRRDSGFGNKETLSNDRSKPRKLTTRIVLFFDGEKILLTKEYTGNGHQILLSGNYSEDEFEVKNHPFTSINKLVKEEFGTNKELVSIVNSSKSSKKLINVHEYYMNNVFRYF